MPPKALFSIALALLMLAPAAADPEMSIASPPLSYYAPVPTFHDQMHRKLGVLVSYAVGPDYSQAILYDSRSREWQTVVSGTFTMEGRRLRCQQAPLPDDVPNEYLCPDWPNDIELYSTPVYFTYWITRLGDREMAVLQNIERAPRR